jgi:hypothetical protein
MSETDNKKRSPTIVDTTQVSKKDVQRLQAWAAQLIHRYESKLHVNIRPGETIATGEITPEEIDVCAIYPFAKDLRWKIWRWHQDVPACWCVMLLSVHKILANFFFQKV